MIGKSVEWSFDRAIVAKVASAQERFPQPTTDRARGAAAGDDTPTRTNAGPDAVLLLGLIGMLLGPLLAWTAAASLGPRALGFEGVRVRFPFPSRVGRGLLGWIEIPEREARHRGRPRARGGPPGNRPVSGLAGPPRRPPSTRPDAGPSRPAAPQRTR